MRIQIVSDIHIDITGNVVYSELIKPGSCSILVLTGDLFNVQNINKSFLSYVSENFRTVIYVLGNHEYYYVDKNLEEVLETFRRELKEFRNIHILEKSCLYIDDYCFAGCTMFSKPIIWFPTKIKCLNDRIRYGTEFLKSVRFIEDVISDCKQRGLKLVMITHYAPTFHCIDDVDNRTCMYASNLNHLIKRENMEAWIYGHTHYNKTFHLNNVLITTNQRGHHIKVLPNFLKEKIVNI